MQFFPYYDDAPKYEALIPLSFVYEVKLKQGRILWNKK
jgi:hypothetical protein